MYCLKNYIGVLLGIVLSISSAFAQVKTEMQSALESGNADLIASYFTPQVDLTLLDQDDLFTKQEAKTLLFNFFQSHKPTSFKELHSGASASGLNYIIGTLSTSTGTFRVSYYYKGNDGSERVQQLMIDSEN